MKTTDLKPSPSKVNSKAKAAPTEAELRHDAPSPPSSLLFKAAQET